MAKKSLLDIVQGILSNIDGDEVNSISDTVESLQVANVVRQTFETLVEEHDLLSNGNLIILESATTPTKPVLMKLPENVSKIEWIRYGTVHYVIDGNLVTDSDGIAEAQLGEGFIDINGVLASGGQVILEPPQYVTLSMPNGADSYTCLVTGELDGAVVTDTLVADVNGNDVGTQLFDLIVSIESDAYDGTEFEVQFGIDPPVTRCVEYKPVCYLTPSEFVRRGSSAVCTADNTLPMSYGPDNVILMVRNDAPPSHWTAFDDEYIVFDSWDSDVETTLISTNFQVFGFTSPVFEMDDEYIPDLPANLFPLLIAESEAYTFSVQKQQLNPKAEQRENRLRVRSQRNKWRVKDGRVALDGPNYGRRC